MGGGFLIGGKYGPVPDRRNFQIRKEWCIALVGGEENISVLTHCATRLRFNLKDNSKADIEALKGLEGVLTAQLKSGQLQEVLRVDGLKHGPSSRGNVGLYVDIGTDGYFRNLCITCED